MNELYRKCKIVWQLARDYPISALGGWKHQRLFEGVETFCLFIGYPRSGHSFIGALLDAHPNIVIAHELDVLKYVYSRYSRGQIYSLLLERSRLYAEGKRRRGGYVYDVPSPWKGKFEKLKVIGDKHGESTTLRLQANPELIGCLQDTIDVPIKFIHVVRNPYDNISTISQKTKRAGRSLNLRESIDYYFFLCEAVTEIKKHIPDGDLFELQHESFVDAPKKYLKGLCQFLGVETLDDYLNDCASVVFQSPRRS